MTLPVFLYLNKKVIMTTLAIIPLVFIIVGIGVWYAESNGELN